MKIRNNQDLAEWIEIIHLQNVNGRETDEDLFRKGIESAIDEIESLGLLKEVSDTEIDFTLNK